MLCTLLCDLMCQEKPYKLVHCTLLEWMVGGRVFIVGNISIPLTEVIKFLMALCKDVQMVKQKMLKKCWLVLIAVLFLLNGCGGGGGSSSDGDTSAGTAGVAVDPYITGAVFEEVSSGGDVLQTSTASKSNGRFNFKKTVQNDSVVRMKTNNKGSHIGKPYEGDLQGAIDPAGELVVSPLTTLLGNGFTAEQVITMLDDAGISGLQESDLYNDPMAGLSGLETFTDDQLTLLQASIAVNTYLLRLNNFSWGPDDQGDVAQLAEATEMVKYCLSLSRYQAVRDQLSATLADFGSPLTIDHLISATSNLLGTLTVAARNGEISDPVAETELLVDGLSELALHYYVQENRGDAALEDAVTFDVLPDIGPSQYPQTDLAGEVTVLNEDSSVPTPDSDTSTDSGSEPGSFELGAASYSVNEEAGTVKVLLNRVDGANGAASVEVRTSGVTADYATDYESFSWTVVNFADGQKNKTISIAITDDAVTESDETFTVLLRNPTDGASLGSIIESTVSIIDNDSGSGSSSDSGTSTGGDTSTDTGTPPTTDSTPDPDLSYIPIFPGAMGFGTETKAGRGGQIIKVTNLNDSGTGSLRAAVSASGPRIIVFEVSGTIELSSTLRVANPYVSIVGQTAPSPGIEIVGACFQISTHDVLVQHVRIRVGDLLRTKIDGLQILGSSTYNVVIDHVSASWGIDESASTYSTVKDITFSNSIISEGMASSYHPEGPHSMGLLIGDHAKNIAIVNNLFAHNKERNPRINGDASVLVVNNVMYNSGSSAYMYIGSSTGKSNVAVMGNAFIDGPSSPTSSKAIGFTGLGANLYVADNQYAGTFGQSGTVSTPPVWHESIKVKDVSTAKSSVLWNAGARPADRDSVDTRVVNEVNSGGGGIIRSQDDVGGYPILSENTRTFNIPSNPNGDDDGDGYTNIEEVLHSMSAQVE